MSCLLTYYYMLVVIFSLALTTPANGTIIIKAGLRLSQSLNNVALGCEDTTNLNVQLPNAVFQRAIGLDNQFMDFNYTVTNDLAEFIITPQTEGRYRCLHGGMTSDPIEVVAYPMPNSDRLQQLSEPITAFVHESSPRIDCTFLEGALSQFYSVEWWKGTTLVYNSTNNAANSPRYTVQELGLVIQNVSGSDASEGYFCRVTVLDPIMGKATTVIGSNTALVVIDDISITSGLIDRMVVSEGSNITHRCTAVSLPAPVLVWRINGTMISSERYRVIAGASTTDGSVTSTLQVTNTISSDSALIECVAINTAGNTPQAISSSSLVTIISKPNSLTLENVDNRVILTAELSTRISRPFFLSLRFTNTTGETTEIITVSDTSFLDTNRISYTIPEDKLPGYAMFSVSAALVVDGRMGPFSTGSNKISAPPGGTTTSTTEPPSTLPSGSNQTIVIALVIVIILLILVVVGCLVALVCVILKKRSKTYQATRDPQSVHDETVRYSCARETAEVKERSLSPSEYSRSSYSHSQTPHSMVSSHSSYSTCTSYSNSTSGRSRSVTPIDNPHGRGDTTSYIFDEPEQVKEKPRQQPPSKRETPVHGRGDSTSYIFDEPEQVKEKPRHQPPSKRETPVPEGGKRKSREGSAPRLDDRKRSHTEAKHEEKRKPGEGSSSRLDDRKRSHTEVAMSTKQEDKRRSSEGIARSNHNDHHHRHHHRGDHHRHHHRHYVGATDSPISPSHAASMPVLEQSIQSTVESLENSLKNSNKHAPVSASTMIPSSSATAAAAATVTDASALGTSSNVNSQIVYFNENEEKARKEKERVLEESKLSAATATPPLGVTVTTQKLDSNESDEEDDFLMVDYLSENKT